MTAATVNDGSRHFSLRRITDGVWAAIAIHGAGSLSNAAFVDLGDRVLVLDTFLTPQAAEDLLRIAEHVTGRPVRYVVNSHAHDDHVLGNQVFPDAVIVATAATRDAIEGRVSDRLAGMRLNPGGFQERIDAYRARLAAARDARERRHIEGLMSQAEELRNAVPNIDLRVPDLTFEDRITLHGPDRRAEIITYGGGHSESDTFVFLPDDGVLLAGDLVPVREHAFVGVGDIDQWLRILDQIAELEFSTVIPGHGDSGTKDDIGAARGYLHAIQRAAREALERGDTPEQAATMPMPDAYREWAWGEVWQWNLRALVAGPEG